MEGEKRIHCQGHEGLLEPLLGVASAHGSWYLGKTPLWDEHCYLSSSLFDPIFIRAPSPNGKKATALSRILPCVPNCQMAKSTHAYELSPPPGQHFVLPPITLLPLAIEEQQWINLVEGIWYLSLSTRVKLKLSPSLQEFRTLIFPQIRFNHLGYSWDNHLVNWPFSLLDFFQESAIFW